MIPLKDNTLSSLIIFLPSPLAQELYSSYIYIYIYIYTQYSIYIFLSSTHIVGGTDADLAQVDGEDGVRARALHVHLSAGGGATQSPELQTLHHLRQKTLSIFTGKLFLVYI